MLSTIPIAMSIESSDVPPREMNGNGIPVVGTSLTLTAMLTKD